MWKEQIKGGTLWTVAIVTVSSTDTDIGNLLYCWLNICFQTVLACHLSERISRKRLCVLTENCIVYRQLKFYLTTMRNVSTNHAHGIGHDNDETLISRVLCSEIPARWRISATRLNMIIIISCFFVLLWFMLVGSSIEHFTSMYLHTIHWYTRKLIDATNTFVASNQQSAINSYMEVTAKRRLGMRTATVT